SKTLGNGIDPLAMVEKYSADAVRFSLLMLTSEGQDINLSESNFEIGRNFSNKLWNSFRFLALSFEQEDVSRLLQNTDYLNRIEELQLADRWILSRLHKTIDTVTTALNEFHLNEAVDNLYSFFWREFCDWYLELIKPRLYGDDQKAKDLALGIGIYALRNILKLLHPLIPFITEEVWQNIKLADDKDLIISSWPCADKNYFHDEAEKDLVLIQQVIGTIRNIRGEMNVPPNKQANVLIRSANLKNLDLIKKNEIYLRSLSRLGKIELGTNEKKPNFSASAVVADLEIFVPLEGLIDIELEKKRLSKEITRLENQIKGINSKLMNSDFIAKAPRDVIDRERQKSNDFQANLEKLQTNLNSLEN
ncbi:MAG TPA: class I tRNA ligase family protein, partial [bacterium]